MLFYDSPNPAPNSRRVRVFMPEKGIRVPVPNDLPDDLPALADGHARASARPSAAA